MSIPKKIHYVWLGRTKKVPLIENCIDSWKLHLSDYEIKEWNEDNFDIESHPFLLDMYAKKNYAFASDILRLLVLKKEGGIYLDTDMEIKKNIDCFLDAKMLLGFMFDCAISAGILGCIANLQIVDDLINIYNNHLEGKAIINNTIVTNYFISSYPEFRLTNNRQVLGDGIYIYPKEYFEVPVFPWEEGGYARHHAINSWNTNKSNPISIAINRGLKALISDVLYSKLRYRKNLLINEFYPIYKKHVEMVQQENKLKV